MYFVFYDAIKNLISECDWVYFLFFSELQENTTSGPNQVEFINESMERQQEYTSLLRDTNSVLREISQSLGLFVNVYAAVHNVNVIPDENPQ